MLCKLLSLAEIRFPHVSNRENVLLEGLGKLVQWYTVDAQVMLLL